MREGRPSFTAACVAFARGVAGVDDLAGELLPPPFGGALRATAALPSWQRDAWDVATLGLVSHLDARTGAIDRALAAALRRGPLQLVILGAGLDARAFRLGGLEETTVFEVDHPSTQAYKRAKTASLTPRAGEVRFVPVDFEKDALDARLAEHGHDGEQATFWIWEGVTPYLPRAAVTDTLARVAARSSAGSRLAVTYGTPDGTAMGKGAMAFGRLVFRAIGEPLRGLLTAAEMAEELARAGFAVLEDTGAAEWLPRASRWLHVRERLAVAER